MIFSLQNSIVLLLGLGDSLSVPLVLAAIAVLTGIGLILYGVQHSLIAFALLRMRPTDGFSISDDGDRVCIEGSVTAIDESLPTPFTDEEAVVVAYEVSERRQQGKQRTWQTISEGSAGVPFAVETGGVAVRVDPHQARFSLKQRFETDIPSGKTPPERIQRFIATNDDVDQQNSRFSLGPLSLPTGRPQRFTQKHIKPGETVTVIGEPTPYPGADVGQAKAQIEGGSPFIVSDAPIRRTALREFGLSLVPLMIGLLLLAIVWVGGGGLALRSVLGF